MLYHEVAQELLSGQAITRTAYPVGTAIYYVLVKQTELFQSPDTSALISAVSNCQAPPILAIRTANRQIVFGWLPTAGDLMANDWKVLSAEELIAMSDDANALKPTPMPKMEILKDEPATEEEIKDAGITEPVE